MYSWNKKFNMECDNGLINYIISYKNDCYVIEDIKYRGINILDIINDIGAYYLFDSEDAYWTRRINEKMENIINFEIEPCIQWVDSRSIRKYKYPEIVALCIKEKEMEEFKKMVREVVKSNIKNVLNDIKKIKVDYSIYNKFAHIPPYGLIPNELMRDDLGISRVY